MVPCMLMITKALTFLHQQKISHRNLNLHSVLIDGSFNEVKISDFTLAVRLKSAPYSIAMRNEDEFMTDSEYLLQVLRGWSRDTQLLKCEAYLPDMLDSWQVGILFYYLILGELPMMPRRGERINFLDVNLTMMDKLCYQLPKPIYDVRLDSLLRGLLRPDARERWSLRMTEEFLEGYKKDNEKVSKKTYAENSGDQVVPIGDLPPVQRIIESRLSQSWKSKLHPHSSLSKPEKLSRYQSLQDRRKAPVPNITLRGSSSSRK
ncbi:unnamed protein product [Oikopleura dioica]|uniref:non-specific serine/threonine protein kinase n=1 Tax=Oikopleura dioica TaxID=34765 RepID=E4XFB9_OIKDI|nr:unnamed protein product [Oikopleura dioica]